MNLSYEDYLSRYNFASTYYSKDAEAFDMWPILVKPLTNKQLNDPHSHGSFQIWYTISGEYEHILNGVRHRQSSGSAIVVFPFSVHQIDSRNSNLDELNVISITLPTDSFTSENIPFQALTFRQASFDSFLVQPLFQFFGKEKRIIDALFEGILCEFRKCYNMDIKIIYSYINIFFELCTNHLAKAYSKKTLINAQDKFKCVNEAVSYISKNRSNDLSLDIISREAMMSQRSFTEAFKDITGQTCHSYINSTRIFDACHMLRTAHNTIDSIADECGFYNRMHFIKAFKAVFNMTPAAFRSDYLKWNEKYGEHVKLQEKCEYEWLLGQM